MREIKFRGKEKSTWKWVYGSLLKSKSSSDGKYMCWIKEPTHLMLGAISTPTDNFHEVISGTVGEFTGLKDKNGVEIFEGDISQYGYVILYNAGKGLFAEHNKRGAIMSYPMDASQVIIIGNIHENPELLNG